jgi:hypothetical protein
MYCAFADLGNLQASMMVHANLVKQAICHGGQNLQPRKVQG